MTLTASRRPLAALTLLLLAAPATAAAQEAVPATPRPSARSTYLGATYGYAHFGGELDPWQLASLSLGRQTAHGSLIGRANYSDRFATRGVQLEMDAYPRLPGRSYGYLNVGYALSGLFPTWRFGAEAFTALPAAWEASLGVRDLRFDGSRVTLLTGSVGKYAGNSWYTLRPYLRSREGGLSASASFATRRYFSDADHYLGASVGYGSTPSDRINPAELERTSSFSLGAEGARRLGARSWSSVSLGYDREELSPDRFRDRVELSTSIRFDL